MVDYCKEKGTMLFYEDSDENGKKILKPLEPIEKMPIINVCDMEPLQKEDLTSAKPIVKGTIKKNIGIIYRYIYRNNTFFLAKFECEEIISSGTYYINGEIKMKKREFEILHSQATINFANTFKGVSEDLDCDILLLEKALNEYVSELKVGKKDKIRKKKLVAGTIIQNFMQKIDLLMKEDNKNVS